MLCAMCISMFQNPERKGLHHKDLKDLAKAAEAGCRICSRISLLVRVSLLCAHEVTDGPFMAYEFEFFSYAGRWEIQFFSNISSAWFESSDTRTFLNRSTNSHIPNSYSEFLDLVKSDLIKEPWRVRDDGFPKKSIPLSTGHPDVAEVSLRWFNTCRFSHADCEIHDSSRDPRWYPKRLLDLGQPNKRLRLLLTSVEPPKDRYATLSHCWGRSPTFLRLGSDNLESFTKDIPSKALPKSFRDAVVTCRRLGIRYLWIDSLCVIQYGKGSKEDWLEHAGNMRLVYLNCVLNLSIDRASGAEEGAFTTRNANRLQTCQVKWDYSGEKPALWNVYDELDCLQSVTQLPLFERGWTDQERLFSPRVLHFAGDRIHWECSKTSRNSVNEYTFNCVGDNIEGFDALARPIFELPTGPYSFKKDSEILQDYYERIDFIWCTTVYDYTRRRLTYPAKDKLVAFAGISQRFEELYHSLYTVGFFSCQLPWALLWQQSLLLFEEHSGEYMAPSFSWAGFPGSVYLTEPHVLSRGLITLEFLTEVSDVHVDLVDPLNKHGQVTSGQITLRSTLLPCAFPRIHDPEFRKYLVEHLCTLCDTMAVDFTYNDGACDPIRCDETNKTPKTERTLTMHLDNMKAFTSHFDQLYLCPVFECIQDRIYNRLQLSKPDGEQHEISHGLVLSVSDYKNKYKRVGTYHAPFLLGKKAIEDGHTESVVII